MFEHLLTLTNDLGLLSEEYDTKGKRLVGNFPQAFSHIALVNAAFDLEDGKECASVLAGRGGIEDSRGPAFRPRWPAFAASCWMRRRIRPA